MKNLSAFAKPLTCVPANATATLTIPVCAITLPLNGETGLSQANRYKLPFYWRPTSSFTGIGDITCTDSNIVLVRATIGSRRDVKVSGLDAIRNGLPAKFCQERHWCLVFITRTEESAQALRNQNAILPERWKALVIYSCAFMIDHTLNAMELARYIVSCASFPFLFLIGTIYPSRGS